MEIKIFDSTLRDGAQGEGISFSVADKLKIALTLDELGLSFIEAGNPGSNNKDMEFFIQAQSLTWKNSLLVAFGSTRKKNIKVENDKNVLALLKAGTKAISIFGKSWDFHVTDILNATLEENLKMIYDTVSFFKEKGKTVIYDAEHFFDGYKENKEYAIKTIIEAEKAGADYIALCDTNGGSFPDEIYDITLETQKYIKTEIGIHCHNDINCGVACSLMAVKAGAKMVQGTFTGFGERCGNANLSSIIASLQLKKDYQCIPKENMINLRTSALKISDIANLTLADGMPYVGNSAFAHKGGMHVDGVSKATRSFEHIDPLLVGNDRRFIISEVAGKSSIVEKIINFAPNVKKQDKEIAQIIEQIKKLEFLGYQFEAADASFEILVRKVLKTFTNFFDVEDFNIISKNKENGVSAVASIKVIAKGTPHLVEAQGDGPVNALDKALRKALEFFYPVLKEVRLTDYKVRVLSTNEATASKVRVLIESTDGNNSWTTIGVSTDIIEASMIALIDSMEYKLVKNIEGGN